MIERTPSTDAKGEPTHPGGPPRLESFRPIFPVRDLRRALAHYRSLGFTTNPYAGGDAYGFADRDGVGLHLAAEAGHDPETTANEAYLYVDDADALYEEWATPGVGGLTRRVGDTPYRLREGSHVDPDGNLMRFGSPMPSRPAAAVGSHLEAHYGIEVVEVSELDAGVWRVVRTDGPDWVARRFPTRRPAEAVAGDAEILRSLADQGFPAERCAAAEPVSVLDGRAVLVTEWIEPVPRNQRRGAIRAAGGLPHLGELLGRLHTLPSRGGALDRRGGAWHHLADGGPAEEVAAAARMLIGAERLIPEGERPAFGDLLEELEALDVGDDLPEALIHPDFVLANVVASPGRMVLVDWAGTGRGPRLWSLAFLLYAEGARDLRRVDRVVAGYRRHVALEDVELSRLATVMRARPLVFTAWAVCTGRTSPTDASASAIEARTLTEAIAARARAAFGMRAD